MDFVSFIVTQNSSLFTGVTRKRMAELVLVMKKVGKVNILMRMVVLGGAAMEL